jgi:hypothetical protein
VTEVYSSPGSSKAKKKQPYWMIYVAALFGGVIMLSDAFSFAKMQKDTLKVGLALILSALFMLSTKAQKIAITAVCIIWLSVIATWIW